MHIYLRHSVHGTKVATMEEEAIFDEEHGWVRYTPGEPQVTVAPQNEMVPRRRGRKSLSEGLTNYDNDSGRPD